MTFLLTKFINGNHEGRDRGVVAEFLNIFGYFLDELMHALEIFFRGLDIVNYQFFFTSALPEETPELLEEAVTTVNTIGVPRLAGFNRPEEHLIEAQRISAIVLDDIVGIDHVVHALRHLFDSPSTDIFAVFEDKFGIVVFRTPLLESLGVEDIVLDQVHPHVDWGRVILVFETF